MQLAEALQLTLPARVAFVGAGGKTSAMFQLARQLPAPVIITTTTHLGRNQLSLADSSFEVKTPDLVAGILSNLKGVTTLTGPSKDPTRAASLSPACLGELWKLAQERGISVLVESDGARSLALKAPAPYEPVIPHGVDCTVVVAGLSALGMPLSDEIVHRPNLFSGLSGLELGDPITSGSIETVLSSPDGGLKGIPYGCRRILLLNQADTLEQQGAGRYLAGRLIKTYERVLVASLSPAIQPGTDSIVSTSGGPVFAVHTRIGAIVLAGGGSKRLGRPKQLLMWQGVPFVRQVAKTAIESGCSPVIVVTGAARVEVEAALQGLPVTIVFNPEWENGQSTSVRAGLNGLPEECGGAVFFLSDQPQVPLTLINLLASTHHLTLAPVIAPEVDGSRANPVLFDKTTFPDLNALTGDVGGRAVFSKYRVKYVPWHDASILIDVDSDADYQRLLSQ